jgi:hypothetical protein
LVEISIAGDTVIFEVQGLDKLWAMKSRIEVPMSHITGARVDPDAARGWWHGIRLPGTNMPGVVTAGTFYQHGRRVFYDVHDTDNTIVIELDHQRYDQLIVEVADPAAEVARIMSAVSSRHG